MIFIFKYFSVGVTINYKFALSLLLLILLLSVSAVSADSTDDENSLNLVNDDAISDISDNGNLNDDGLDNADSDDLGVIDGVIDGAIDSGTNSAIDSDDADEEPALKNTSLEIISQDDWEIYGNEDYYVKLLDENNDPVSQALINFRIENPEGKFIYETAYTDDEGIAVLALDLSTGGIHNIQVSYDGDLNYNPADSVYSNVIFYENTIIKTPKDYSYIASDFTVKLVDSKGQALSNQILIIYLDGVKYDKTTDSNGQVYLRMPSDKNYVEFNCTFEGEDYYLGSSLSMKLPVYKKTYTKPLVYTILKGKCFKILLKGIDGKILKNEQVKFTINGKTYTRTTNDKGIAYIKLKLPRNRYKVIFSYDNNGVYGPSCNSSYLEIIDPSGQFKKGLNQNTKLSVKKYLSGGGYAKITKAIRKLSLRLTSKYSTKLEKATAIFNYVRDNLGYSYYANSKKGAAKTLRTKRGNCCDHSNLIVALCRASKIPARYAHAKRCKFGSGLVTGHVWAQIYVNGRWYSADGTSYRNSLGHIKNWNTKSYKRLHTYRNIPF